jgi:hypothetical protein
MPILLILLFLASCGQESPGVDEGAPPSHLEPSAPPPAERRPLREGFPQRPPKDTPGLPPPAEPLFTEAELAEMKAVHAGVSDAERDRAQAELLGLIEEYEETGSEALVARIRSSAVAHARTGRVSYSTAEAFFAEFLFPRDVEAALSRYRGKAVLVSGSVAPHNMVDLADGFKLVEQTPYIHEPVLLATEYELSFVRCHLARKELQKLRDWQDVHLLAVVEEKFRGDLVLRRCVVL